MVNLFLIAAPLLPLTADLPGPEAKGSVVQEGEIVVTILFDNYAADDRLGTGWGFAALLETDGHTVLFDTGADGDILLENFRLLGKDPAAVESVIISHAHGDHTGGIQALLNLGIQPRFFLLPGFPAGPMDELAGTHEVVMSAPGQEIVSGIRTTGQVGGPIPEQALLLETRDGIVVLTGCAHPGVVAMAERAQELGSGSLHAVMGGFHLMEATDDQLQRIIARFRELGIQEASPTHCSGDHTMEVFREAYGAGFQELGSGRVLRFPRASG
jgi:7,8-dihydropterin-6-yl-methyl-4-(beta-D-ribofuranosyl)aminobenzene 5'-phosphate synthase